VEPLTDALNFATLQLKQQLMVEVVKKLLKVNFGLVVNTPNTSL